MAARLNGLITWLSRSRWSHLIAAVVFTMLTVWYFAPAALGDRAFTVTAAQQGVVYPWAAQPATQPFALQSDQADLSLPLLRLQHSAYADGEVPFWDPYSYGGGYPTYADFSSGQAYPPRMIAAWLFEPIDAHLAFAMLHVFAAGMFTYLFARRLGSRWIAAVLAGSAWMYGGWTLAWVQLAPILVSSALLPAGLWAMHRACADTRWAPVGLAGVLLGANVVAGHALFGFVTAAIVALYGAGLSVQRAWPQRTSLSRRALARQVAVVPAAVGVGAGLWAFILLPMGAVVGGSSRAGLTYAELTATQLGGRELLTSILRAPPSPMSLRDFNGIAFVGTFVGVLAIVGLLTRRPGSWLGRCLVVVLALVALGGPLTWITFHVVPGMNVFRPYTRLAMFVGFGVVLLAVCGFDALADRAAPFVGNRNRPLLRPLLFALAAVAVAANSVQLRTIGRNNNPAFPPDTPAYALPDTDFAAALRAAQAATTSPGRAVQISPLATDGDAWSPPILWAAESAWLGVETASGYNALVPQRTVRMLRVLTGENTAAVLARDSLGAYIPEFHWRTARYDVFARQGYNLVITPPRLNEASVWGQLHVATGELEPVYSGVDGNVFRITGAEPGPWAARAVEVVETDDDALLRVTDPALPVGTLVLTAGQAQRMIAVQSQRDARELTVAAARRTTNGFRFTATNAPPADTTAATTAATTAGPTTAGSTLVVVPINWDAGWSATVNGRDVAVGRGNYNQIVLRLPAGESNVELSFRPPLLTAGIASTVVTMLVLGGAPLARRAKRAVRQRKSGITLVANNSIDVVSG